MGRNINCIYNDDFAWCNCKKIKNIDFLVITEDKWKKEVDKRKDTIIKFLKGENN